MLLLLLYYSVSWITLCIFQACHCLATGTVRWVEVLSGMYCWAMELKGSYYYAVLSEYFIIMLSSSSRSKNVIRSTLIWERMKSNWCFVSCVVINSTKLLVMVIDKTKVVWNPKPCQALIQIHWNFYLKNKNKILHQYKSGPAMPVVQSAHNLIWHNKYKFQVLKYASS